MTQNSLPGPKMIFIPGGMYQMGERGDFRTVGDFLMDETPVTVAQYREAVNAGAVSAITNRYSNYCLKGREDHPVNCIDWYQACAYAEWTGKRLPTEEEWEWAARGGPEGRTYPWGNEEPSDQLCWSGDGNDLDHIGRISTSPVGSYPKGNSKHGLKDMVGNISEWTYSIYIDNSNYRTIRSDCWYSRDPEFVRVSYRFYHSPLFNYDYLGFRCARTT